MSGFFGSLLAKAAVIALEALVVHLVQVVIQNVARRFATQREFATA
ncbi:hypothetical protein [Herbidospora sp. NBRC 101105]|nr:hypothetical protein [Herbidospora sp. NBRC 101105]GLX99376.1 hypothetical protein Hesp01_73260 [Herbidospora sp. NBRC 101105]